MKNHVTSPAEFIAPPKFSCQRHETAMRIIHYTPYLPAITGVYTLNYYLWAERLWKLYDLFR